MTGSWSLALAKLQCICYSSMQGLCFLTKAGPRIPRRALLVSLSATPWPSLHGKLGHGNLASQL
jgi:hypothetical protein